LGYVQKGKDEGAELVLGGNRMQGKGFFMEPTIFANVTEDMTIFQEEIFGPVLSITKFSTIDEAIEKANNSAYGLTAGVCTTSLESMIEVSNALKAGQIFVNTWLAT
jgi:aldehyde dehydrogenase (NAD+)